MENVRNRSTIKIVNGHNAKGLEKLIAKPNYKSAFKFENSELVSVNMGKSTVKLNKPIYLGQAILDISKTLMYDFHYNYIKPMYGEKAKLLFTDTDSLCYHIETEDFYKDIVNDVPRWFDTSGYPENHPSSIPTGMNKKEIGKMKDECNGKQMTEFVGLRPKLYAFRVDNNEGEKKCKGVKKAVVKDFLTFENYKDCLFNDKT